MPEIYKRPHYLKELDAMEKIAYECLCTGFGVHPYIMDHHTGGVEVKLAHTHLGRKAKENVKQGRIDEQNRLNALRAYFRKKDKKHPPHATEYHCKKADIHRMLWGLKDEDHEKG